VNSKTLILNNNQTELQYPVGLHLEFPIDFNNYSLPTLVVLLQDIIEMRQEIFLQHTSTVHLLNKLKWEKQTQENFGHDAEILLNHNQYLFQKEILSKLDKEIVCINEKIAGDKSQEVNNYR